MRTYLYHTHQLMTRMMLKLYSCEDVIQCANGTDALQIAYSMGAMSVKAYQMETKNPGYDN